jgi:uncharacterized Tic20 family protein
VCPEKSKRLYFSQLWYPFMVQTGTTQVSCPYCDSAVSPTETHCPDCGARQDPRNVDGTDYRSEYRSRAQNDGSYLLVLVHFLGFVTWVVGPALVYLVVDDEYIKQHAVRSLQWGVTLGSLVGATLVVFLGPIVLLGVFSVELSLAGLELALIALVTAVNVLFVLGMSHLLACIIGAHKAEDGELWEYPLTGRLFDKLSGS